MQSLCTIRRPKSWFTKVRFYKYIKISSFQFRLGIGNTEKIRRKLDLDEYKPELPIQRFDKVTNFDIFTF